MAQSSDTATRRNGATRHALKSRAGDVLDDFSELRKDVGRLADAASKAARAEVKTASKRLERASRKARTRVGESAEYVSDQVRSHPGMAIGASLGAGMLIGWLLSRR